VDTLFKNFAQNVINFNNLSHKGTNDGRHELLFQKIVQKLIGEIASLLGSSDLTTQKCEILLYNLQNYVSCLVFILPFLLFYYWQDQPSGSNSELYKYIYF
jgi:hypothetical protein